MNKYQKEKYERLNAQNVFRINYQYWYCPETGEYRIDVIASTDGFDKLDGFVLNPVKSTAFSIKGRSDRKKDLGEIQEEIVDSVLESRKGLMNLSLPEDRKNIIKLHRGDIADMDADIIVNAANPDLILGSGVSGALKYRGGEEFCTACIEAHRKYGRIEPGQCIVTPAGRLKAKHVIHTTPPLYGDPGWEMELRKATAVCLNKAHDLGARSIVFPALGTGAYRIPPIRCANIMTETIKRNYYVVEDITICLYTEEIYGEFACGCI